MGVCSDSREKLLPWAGAVELAQGIPVWKVVVVMVGGYESLEKLRE